MAQKNKLKDTPISEIVKLANQGGQKHAAETLKVSQAAISTRLTQEGYIPRIVYIRKESA